MATDKLGHTEFGMFVEVGPFKRSWALCAVSAICLLHDLL